MSTYDHSDTEITEEKEALDSPENLKKLNMDDNTVISNFLKNHTPWKAAKRPISQIQPNPQPKHVKTLLNKDPKLQAVVCFSGVLTIGLFSAWIFGYFDKKPSTALTPAQVQANDLASQNKALEDKFKQERQKNLTGNETAQFREFKEKARQQSKAPGSTIVTATARPQSQPRRGQTPQPSNIIPVPRPPAYNPRKTRAAAPPRAVYSPPQPTFKPASKKKDRSALRKECFQYAQNNLETAECKGIFSKINKPPQRNVLTAAVPPVPQQKTSQRKYKPLKLSSSPAYKKPTKKPRKPSYQVNYAAGEMQTYQQFQDEFYGSGDRPSVSKTPEKFNAKIIGSLQWVTQEDAQAMAIPLEITTGKLKGQTAIAKIASMKGHQFTAYLTHINDVEVEENKYELTKKKTKYLQAKLKRQGGESFGSKILNAAVGIASDTVADRTANIQGGNRLTGLLPNGNRSQGQAISQYYEFKGDVEIVKKM